MNEMSPPHGEPSSLGKIRMVEKEPGFGFLSCTHTCIQSKTDRKVKLANKFYINAVMSRHQVSSGNKNVQIKSSNI